MIIRTAYHEAGHAVAAAVQGLTINKVNIIPNNDCLGSCNHPPVLMTETSSKRKQKQVAKGHRCAQLC